MHFTYHKPSFSSVQDLASLFQRGIVLWFCELAIGEGQLNFVPSSPGRALIRIPSHRPLEMQQHTLFHELLHAYRIQFNLEPADGAVSRWYEEWLDSEAKRLVRHEWLVKQVVGSLIASPVCEITYHDNDLALGNPVAFRHYHRDLLIQVLGTSTITPHLQKQAEAVLSWSDFCHFFQPS